jgi:hypothetical protein
VRSAILGDFQINDFKYIIYGSKEQNVYNTLFNSLVPVSFITPKFLVFKDVNIGRNKNSKTKLPVVANPVGAIP